MRKDYAGDSRTERLENFKWQGECCLWLVLPFLLSGILYFVIGPIPGFILLVLCLFVAQLRYGLNFIEAGIPCVLGAIAFYIFYPVFLQARAKSQSTTCLYNAKQLAQSTLLYAQDYDNVLPYDATAFTTLISPHIKDRKAFTCPLDLPGVTSYAFNRNLSNMSRHAITSPAQTVLIYEGIAGKLNYRHVGQASVVFVNGSCRHIGPDKASTLVWTAPVPLKK